MKQRHQISTPLRNSYCTTVCSVYPAETACHWEVLIYHLKYCVIIINCYLVSHEVKNYFIVFRILFLKDLFLIFNYVCVCVWSICTYECPVCGDLLHQYPFSVLEKRGSDSLELQLQVNSTWVLCKSKLLAAGSSSQCLH